VEKIKKEELYNVLEVNYKKLLEQKPAIVFYLVKR